MIDLDASEKAIARLFELGFGLHTDERPTKFVVRDEQDRRVDFHTVTFDEGGGGLQMLQDGRAYRYPSDGLVGTGVVAGRRMSCLTAEVQIECHVGYEPDANDFHDMRLLSERFGLEVPPPFD